MRADVTVHIAAPPERVWSIVADIGAWPTWTDSITTLTPLDAGPLRVGSRAKIKQPRLPVTTWTVTELVEGRSFVWVATGPGFRTVAEHRVEPAGDGSVVTLSIDQRGPVGWLVGRATTALTKRYLAMEAEGLRHRAEHPTR